MAFKRRTPDDYGIPEQFMPFINALTEKGYTYSGDEYGWFVNSRKGIRMVSASKRYSRKSGWQIKCYAQEISALALLFGIQVIDVVSALENQTNDDI
ncbi:hypothetical protein VPHK479_0109 [Vibrio phage K479]